MHTLRECSQEVHSNLQESFNCGSVHHIHELSRPTLVPDTFLGTRLPQSLTATTHKSVKICVQGLGISVWFQHIPVSTARIKSDHLQSLRKEHRGLLEALMRGISMHQKTIIEQHGFTYLKIGPIMYHLQQSSSHCIALCQNITASNTPQMWQKKWSYPSKTWNRLSITRNSEPTFQITRQICHRSARTSKGGG